MYTDTEIKQTAMNKPERAKEMLVEEYSPRLFAYALRLTRNAEEALDLAQETLIKGLLEERIFHDDFQIKSWLFRVCTHLTYDLFRKAKRFFQKMPLFSETSDNRDFAESLIEKEENTQLSDALKKIPEKFRTLLILRYFEEMSYQEVSDITGLAMGTVMSRLNRAKSLLKGVYLHESV